MEKHIIFEDEHIRAIWMQGSSEELVFSFGDLITRAKGLSINAEKSLAKYEFNTIGIMPKEKSWFPEASMKQMLIAIQDYIAPFKQRLAYGGSMGGYAVVKYSKLLGLKRAVALVPQYSINPDDVHDPRYNMFYQLESNANMQIQPQDVQSSCEYIGVYDPYYAEDRIHFEKIKHVIPNILSLKLPYTGHDAIAVLANSKLLHDFLRHGLDAEYFYAEIRRVKKNSKFYYRKVIEQLLPRHGKALGKILKHNALELDRQFFDAKLKQVLLRELLKNKQVDQQDLLKLGIEVNLPQESRNQLIDALEHGLVFNVISQKIESYNASAIALNHKFLLPIYAKGNGLLTLQMNDERYLITMNDRMMMKLVKEQDELSVGMHPLVLKKYSDYYAISYKHLHLASDEYGATQFSEQFNEYCQFYSRENL